jgi:ubiquinone/menaquinone biosynthesis C-methylase UbiE
VLNNRVRRFLEPPARLISKLDLNASDVVVDFGCGPGFYTIPIAKMAARTIAVDISPQMLKKTGSNAKKNGVTVELLTTDATSIKLEDQSVDLIFLNHVFHEVVNRRKILSEFLRILKRSGRLVIVERTRGGFFSRRVGPPIVDTTEVAQDLKQYGFSTIETITYGNDSILVGRGS